MQFDTGHEPRSNNVHGTALAGLFANMWRGGGWLVGEVLGKHLTPDALLLPNWARMLAAIL